MSHEKTVFLIVTTVATEEQAAELINKLLSEKLAACVSVSNVRSHYVWQNKLEETNEMQLQIKTSLRCHEALYERLIEIHPYDTPEILSFETSKANQKYVDWVENSCASSQVP